ncbi:hypothetical protein CDIK_1246 [Cucumispora dikerogammari]|nr:hypothetical protein CDIK_1246 [Cucumispora dikerogammari]
MMHPKDKPNKINKKTQKRPKTDDKKTLLTNTESVEMIQIDSSTDSSCFHCSSKSENCHKESNKYSIQNKNTNTIISNELKIHKKEARSISTDKTHKPVHQTEQTELNQETCIHDSFYSITDSSTQNIASLNDIETLDYIKKLITEMKSCNMMPPKKVTLFKKNSTFRFIIKVYQKIRVSANIAGIFIFALFILSVVYSSISCYINLTPLRCQLESIDLKIDKEINLQIKIRTLYHAKIPLKLSNLSVSVISINNEYRLFKIIAKEVKIPTDDIPIEFNFKGIYDKNTPVYDIVEKMKATGFKVCFKVKVQFDGILGLKSNIDIEKTIGFTKNADGAKNSGILFNLLKGEQIDFTKTYKDEKLTDFFFFDTNTVEEDGFEGEIIPLKFLNMNRISLSIKDLEIGYFGDNLVTERVFFEYLNIENGRLMPFKTDNENLSSIDVQLELVNAFVSNQKFYLQEVNICGISFLSEFSDLKETKDKGKPSVCDYKIIVNHLSLNVIDITIHSIDKSLGGLDSFLKTACVTLDKIKKPNILFKMTTLDETPGPICTIRFSCVFEQKKSINLLLTDIDLHLFVKALKNSEIVKILVDGSSKYEGFMCFKTLLPPSKNLETIHTRRKEKEKQGASSYFLKSTLKPKSLDKYTIENWINLTASPTSLFFKNAFHIEILDTELQISNDFCSVSLSVKKQTLKKTEKTPNLEQGFVFDLNIETKKFSEYFDLRKYFTFPLDNNKEICFIGFSRNPLSLKACVGLSNSAHIYPLLNSVVSMKIKRTEEIFGGFNCDINLPARYILADEETQRQKNKRSCINISFVNNRILFNRFLFSFKNCDLISMIINRKINILDPGSTNYSIHLPSLIINSQLSKNVLEQTNKPVSAIPQIKEPDSLQSLKTYINEINNLVDLDISKKCVYNNNKPTFEFKLMASEDCKNFKFFLSFYNLPDTNSVIKKFKENFLKFNSHSHYSESRSDPNIDNEIKQMLEKIMQLFYFPFNNVKCSFKKIKFNLKENGEEINILKIKKPHYSTFRNPKEFKIKGEISLRGLLKILTNENSHFEIIIYPKKGNKILFYKTEENLVITLIKQYLQKPKNKDENFNVNKTFFVFSSNRKAEGMFLKEKLLTAYLSKICFLPRSIPFIKLFNSEYKVILDFPYENLVSFYVPPSNSEEPVEIEILRNNFSTLACAILIQYLFYAEEPVASWEAKLFKFLAVGFNGCKSYTYDPLKRLYNAIKYCISYISYNFPITIQNTFLKKLSSLYKKSSKINIKKRDKNIKVRIIEYFLMQKFKKKAQLNQCLDVSSYIKSKIELSHKPFPFCTTLSLHLDKSNGESLGEREIWRFDFNGYCLKQVLIYNQQLQNVIRLDLIISFKSNNMAFNNVEKSQEAEFYRYIIRYYGLFQEYLESSYLQELEFRSFIGYV